jgi:hypothetical protein
MAPTKIEGKKNEDEDAEKIIYTPSVIGRNLIAEEVYDPELGKASFNIRYFDQDLIKQVGEIKDGLTGLVYKPLVNQHLTKRLVLLPTKAVPSTFEEVFNEGCNLGLEIYDCESHNVEEFKFLIGVAQSSWYYDRFSPDPKYDIAGAGKFAPIIGLRGSSGGGKDRMLNALRFNSYRPFYDVSTDRIPSLYRPMDLWRGTLCLSEMDMARTDETSPLIHYLNCRCYGVPIARQNPDNARVGEAFYNFGDAIITQRRPFEDNGTEDRTLPFYCEKTQKPIATVELNEWIEKGVEIQNKLLYLRLMNWEKIVIDKGQRIEGVMDHRLTASALPLLAMGKIAPAFSSNLGQILLKLERKRKEVKAQSRDGIMVNFLWDKVEKGLAQFHNGSFYIGNERVKDKDGDDVLKPLIPSDIEETLKWHSKQIRGVVHSLQLYDSGLEPQQRITLSLGTFRPIWFTHERFEKRLLEFVVDYRQGDLEAAFPSKQLKLN